MNRAHGDLVRVVEVAYEHRGSDGEWLAAVVDAARPSIDAGLGVVGALIDDSAGRFVASNWIARGGMESGVAVSARFHDEVGDDFNRRIFLHTPVSTLTENLGPEVLGSATPEMRATIARVGMSDHF